MQKVINQICKVVRTEIDMNVERDCALFHSEMREFIMNVGYDMDARLYAIKLHYCGVE
jgi:hypothetical protein